MKERLISIEVVGLDLMTAKIRNLTPTPGMRKMELNGAVVEYYVTMATMLQ